MRSVLVNDFLFIKKNSFKIIFFFIVLNMFSYFYSKNILNANSFIDFKYLNLIEFNSEKNIIYILLFVVKIYIFIFLFFQIFIKDLNFAYKLFLRISTKKWLYTKIFNISVIFILINLILFILFSLVFETFLIKLLYLYILNTIKLLILAMVALLLYVLIIKSKVINIVFTVILITVALIIFSDYKYGLILQYIFIAILFFEVLSRNLVYLIERSLKWK